MGHGSVIGFKTSCGGEDIRLFKRVYSGKVVKSKEESHAATTNVCVLHVKSISGQCQLQPDMLQRQVA